MPQHRPPGIIRSGRVFRRPRRTERRRHPACARLALIGAGALGLSAVLVAIHLSVLAQLVGGLAVLPLSLAAFLRLLPPMPWTDHGPDGWGRGRGGDNDEPWPPDGPTSDLDWDSFERQFRAYAEAQQLVGISVA